MDGTVPQKICRIICNLIAHPNYIRHYIAHNMLAKYTLDLEIPWFSYAAIDFLNSYLRPDMTVFEYGSGGSTLYFATRVRSVYSVEDDSRWFEMVSARLREKNLHNATVKYCTYDAKNPADFEESDYFKAIPAEKFDIQVIDSSEPSTMARYVRPACFRKAEEHVSPNGIIVVDDSWRYPALRENNRAYDVKVFQSIGPCRIGVTSTDIFFY